MPSNVQILTVQLNSYRGNSLRDVKSAYLRLSSNNEVIGTYSINQAGDNIGLLFGYFIKNNNSNSWHFRPLNRVIPGRKVTYSITAVREILLSNNN